jgi:glucans biosynthesis protein C
VSNVGNTSKSSVALHNLRGFTILLVVAFHSAMAYLAYNPAPQPRYEPPPLISDAHRWIGFDLFCAAQYVFLMQFMFLLSGLFVWSSLNRRGGAAFLYNRFLRLGVPFLVGVYLLIPVTHYPIYRLIHTDPTWSGYWTEWTSFPYSQSGHLWFLWCLLVLDAAAAALHRFAPRIPEALGRLSTTGKENPVRYFAALLGISAVAYVPISMKFMPWEWGHLGPFAVQPSYVLLYIVYFFAGLGIGAHGLDAGLFSQDGRLADRWRSWVAIAFAGFLLWMAATALSMEAASTSSPMLQVLASIGFVIACTSACFALAAVFLRFETRPSRILNALGQNAFGIYFFHYAFVLWLQYMLLDLPLVAGIKFAVVFTGTLFLSWAATAVVSEAAQRTGLLPRPSPVLASSARSRMERT